MQIHIYEENKINFPFISHTRWENIIIFIKSVLMLAFSHSQLTQEKFSSQNKINHAQWSKIDHPLKKSNRLWLYQRKIGPWGPVLIWQLATKYKMSRNQRCLQYVIMYTITNEGGGYYL